MKKFFAAFALVLSLSFNLSADEGMWMLPTLQKMNGRAMSSLGCKVSPSAIFNSGKPALTDAIVHFGNGCTGEIVSAEGLMLTNHHCGYSSIQKLSTPENNYLEDGYWAMSRNDELPVPGLTATFLESMTDVTDALRKVGDRAYKKARRANPTKAAENAIAAYKSELEDKARAENPDCEARVVDFYNGNAQYLIVTRTYKDVRFVGAPPASIGKFGGGTDNWMWPRHTCDFSMFRVYAGSDNAPADYSPNNVPYVPKQYLKISTKGYKEGSFGMVIGYPGRTQRYQTAVQLQEMLNNNDIRIEARDIRLALMKEAMRNAPVTNLQYASKYASASNGWKKWRGMKESFEKLNIIGREQKKEREFVEWEQSNKKTREKYDGALERINQNSKLMATDQQAMTLLSETILSIELVRMSKQAIGNISAFESYNPELDKAIAVEMMKYYIDHVKPADAIEVPEWSFNKDNIVQYVDELFEKSVFTSAEKYSAAVEAGIDFSKDPASILRKAAVAKYTNLRSNVEAFSKDMSSALKAYTAGLLEWNRKKPSYPDANSTMRLTYGTVKGYSPRDAVIYKHYSTIRGVLEKEDPENPEFRVPDRLKVMAEAGNFGEYANAEGELPACFLMTCDITGGNSGSPVLDASGNLIGLAFDGNWEAMSSDVMFEPELQRCICVDIRYVLAIIDKFGGAVHLINEMEFVSK